MTSSMTSRIFLKVALFMVLASVCEANAQTSPVFRVVPATSKVEFSLSHLAGRASGRFETFEGALTFLPSRPELSKISFTVKVASIDTENTKRDEHLRADDYFDATRYPNMTFQSKSFRAKGDGKYEVNGTLTIKGSSKEISVPVVLVRSGQTWATGEDILNFKGSFAVDRTEFGVGESSSALGDEVKVALDLKFRASR